MSKKEKNGKNIIIGGINLMVIFFIVLIILFAISIVLVTQSSFKIEIKKLILIDTKVKEFIVVISLNLFNKLRWLSIKLDRKKIEKIRNGTKLKIFNKMLDTKVLRKYKNAKQILKKDWKHVLKNLDKVKIEKIDIQSKLGTENAAVTAISVGLISAILGIILASKTENPKYKIEPVYIDKNYIYLSINCIIRIKLVHIINMNKKLGKEVYQNYGRTSNRRTYANSNG